MKVYEALARAFVEEGTSTVFSLIGDSNQHWNDAIAKLGVTMYQVRHEGPGLAMAEAWAQTSGSPGVCSVASGCGVAHFGTQMLVASRSGTPLVAFCGDTPLGSEDGNQRMNQELFAAATECGFVRVARPDRAYDAVQKAFYIARSESRPVMLSAPKDVQLKPFDDEDEEYVPSTRLLSSLPVYPNPDAVEQAAEAIARSKNIVIVVGVGAQRSGAKDLVLKLANRTGALLATSLLAMNWLRDEYEYHAGISGLFSTGAAMDLLQQADCVIAIGASLNRYTTVHGLLYPDATFVQIDEKPRVVMGSGRVADCYVQADAKLGLVALDAALDARDVSRVGYQTPETRERLAHATDDLTEFEIEPGMLDPREVCRVLDEMTPSSFGLNLGGGHQFSFGAMLFTRPRAFTVLNKYFGAMGKGVMGSIGASIAAGFQPVVVTEGDGGFMMHLQEFETAVRYNVPLLVVVMNDQGLGAETRKARSLGLDPAPSQMTTPDLGLLGQAMGGRGAKIASIEHLREEVAKFVQEPAPTVLDVRIPDTLPSITHRRLWHGGE